LILSEMTGRAGFTVTVKVPEPMLPVASVAVHVTVVVPMGKVDPEGGVQTAPTGPSTASTAEALKVATAPAVLVAATVRSPGRVSTGPLVSSTVIPTLASANAP